MLMDDEIEKFYNTQKVPQFDMKLVTINIQSGDNKSWKNFEKKH